MSTKTGFPWQAFLSAAVLRPAPYALLLLLSPGATSATTLTANTTVRPNMCLYKPAETVSIKFDATGANGQTLTMTIKDAEDVVVKTQNFTVNADPWTVTATGYNTKLGFYRVFGSLSGGATISALGSRPAGFTTYAIVPDPALRPAVTEFEARFGIQGGVSPSVGSDIMAFMGWRWAIEGNWNWAKVAPTQGGAFVTPTTTSYNWATNGSGGAWPMFNLPNLTKDGRPWGGGNGDNCNPGITDVYKANTFKYNTGALDPAYYTDWQNFCGEVATRWPQVYPTRTQPVYEVTWEPIQTWGYRGTDADLVTMYQLAFDKIATISSTACVAGPCMHISSSANLQAQYELFDLGLGNYIDVYTAHPYMNYDIATSPTPFKEPELAGQPCLLHTMKRKLREYMGRDIPMIGTEQGYNTRQDVTKELFQAQRLTRSNLLVLGEGWRANTAFYFADYWTHDTIQEPDTDYWDYGFFYNLDTAGGGGYCPTKVSPKPIVAAYAAMTSLLEKRNPTCDINWLDDYVRGYAFENSSDVLLALWCFKNASASVTIDTGAASVDVYDMWGNKTTTATTNGSLTLTLTQNPTYIKGVAPRLWGSSRVNRNIAVGKIVTASTSDPSYPATLAVDADSVSHLSRWVSVSDGAKPSHWIAVDFGGNQTIDEVRFWTGSYSGGSGNSTYFDYFPKYKVQYWNGTAYVDICSRVGNTKCVISEKFAPLTTSKVRVLVPQYEMNQVKLYEVEVLAVMTNEAEDLSVTASGATTSVIVDPLASSGDWIALNADGIGDWFEFTVPNVQAGSYSVKVLDKPYNVRGKYQLSIGGANLGAVVDQYASAVTYRGVTVGTRTFATTGNQVFRFSVTGKNASSSGYGLSVDAIVLIPISTCEAENLIYSVSGATASLIVDALASAGNWISFASDGIGDSITFTAPVAAGTYTVQVMEKTYNNRGKYQLSVGGVNVGPVMDQYTSAATYRTTTVGNVTVTSSGDQEFTFSVTGKNASSSSYALSIDALILTPQ